MGIQSKIMLFDNSEFERFRTTTSEDASQDPWSDNE